MNAAAILEALTTPQGRADPYPLYARARELGPVVPIDEGWFLVSSYTAVNRILRTPGFGIIESEDEAAGHQALAELSRSILRTNPPDHARMRSLIATVFTPPRVRALQPVVEAAVDELLDRLADKPAEPVDFMEEFAFQLPVSVICALLGIPQTDRGRFRALAADLTVALEMTAGITELAPADAAAQELSDHFTGLIAERRSAPRDDMITALVAARDAEESRLSEVELLANLVVLLVAGFETTTNLLGNGLAILLRRPDLAARLRSEQVPVPGFVEEVLRYDSPVQATTRLARTDDLLVEGVPIPKGSQLFLLIGSANRDTSRYPNADEFDPTRSGSAPLSFGAGAHICIGNALARLEAVSAFSRLLARFPDLAAAGTPTRRDRLVLRGFDTLPITLTEPAAFASATTCESARHTA